VKITDLKTLCVEQLQDLHNAENQLIKALPKMRDAATDPDLKQAFDDHLQETKEHARRIEEVMEGTEFKARGEHCPAMEGLIKEGSEMLKIKDEQARDAALICAAQKVEHYEIASYGSVLAYARMLGWDETVTVLEETLDQEKSANDKLTMLAEKSINAMAMPE
jgi:ferritin-like metal-binding protein YciE